MALQISKQEADTIYRMYKRVIGQRGGLAKGGKKARSSRKNGLIPPRPGSRPRGRPRKHAVGTAN